MSLAILIIVVSLTVPWTAARTKRVAGWAKWNYEGFESKSAWPLYQEITKTLQGTFQDPRVAFEHSSKHNVFGTSRAFESLPLFSGRATLEGAYMQASASAPFIFYLQSEISKQRSCPFKQYACTDLDYRRARPRLKMFNVRDVIVRSAGAKKAIRNTGGFIPAYSIGDYEVWSLDQREWPYVIPLTNEPVYIGHENWQEKAYQWFKREKALDVHLIFGPEASGADAQPFRLVSDSFENLKKVPIDTRGCRIAETILNDEIRIETNWIGKPLLIKMSYHPAWQVEGADRIYLASPSFMLVYPNKEQVRLAFGPGNAEWWGWGLTIAGIGVLLVNMLVPRQCLPSVRPILNKYLPFRAQGLISMGRFEHPVPRRLFAAGLVLSVLIVSGSSVQVYRNEPNRMFNSGIRLKDAKKYKKAREAFGRVLSNASPVSGLAEDAAYYIAICYFLDADYTSSIKAFADLTAQFDRGRRTSEALYHIGLCYFRMGQEATGVEQMKRLIENHPDSPWSMRASKRLIEHRGFD